MLLNVLEKELDCYAYSEMDWKRDILDRFKGFFENGSDECPNAEW